MPDSSALTATRPPLVIEAAELRLVRLPLVTLTDGTKARIKAAMSYAGLL